MAYQPEAIFLWGVEDQFQKVSFGERLISDLPFSTLVRIEDAGHWLMLDQPEVVSKEILSFLTSRGRYHLQGQEISPTPLRS